MKTIDLFLVKEILKTFRKGEIAYYIDDIQTYEKALASVRMQCYDMIEWLEKEGVHAEIYRPFKTYKLVFFIKTRTAKAVKTAEELYKKNVPLLMYAFYEKIDDETNKEDWERNNILQLLKYMKAVYVVGKIQQYKFAKYHKNVVITGDMVHNDFFKIKKMERNKKPTLLYCGYHGNLKDLIFIEDIINEMVEVYNCEMLIITEKDPGHMPFPYRYIKYVQKNIATLLTKGDIMIAPRTLEGVETMSFSNVKIAYPMAIGVPVVATPIPSYQDSPALLCKTKEEWKKALLSLIIDQAFWNKKSEESGTMYFISVP